MLLCFHFYVDQKVNISPSIGSIKVFPMEKNPFFHKSLFIIDEEKDEEQVRPKRRKAAVKQPATKTSKSKDPTPKTKAMPPLFLGEQESFNHHTVIWKRATQALS